MLYWPTPFQIYLYYYKLSKVCMTVTGLFPHRQAPRTELFLRMQYYIIIVHLILYTVASMFLELMYCMSICTGKKHLLNANKGKEHYQKIQSVHFFKACPYFNLYRSHTMM